MDRFYNDSDAAAVAAATAAAPTCPNVATSPHAPATADATASSPTADPSSPTIGNSNAPTAAAHPAPAAAHTNATFTPSPSGHAVPVPSLPHAVAAPAVLPADSASPVQPASSTPIVPNSTAPTGSPVAPAAATAPSFHTQGPGSAAGHSVSPLSPLTGDPAADPAYARDLIRLLEDTGGRKRWMKAMPRSVVVKIWPRINPATDPAAYHYSLLLLHVAWRHEDELLGGHDDHTAAFLAQRSRITAATANDIMGQAVEAECRRLHAAGMCTLADMDNPQHGLCSERLATQCAPYDPTTFVTTQARGSPSDIAAAMVVQADMGGVAAGQVGPRMTDHTYALRLASMSAAQRVVHSRVRDHVLHRQGAPGALRTSANAPNATAAPPAATDPAATDPAATAAPSAAAAWTTSAPTATATPPAAAALAASVPAATAAPNAAAAPSPTAPPTSATAAMAPTVAITTTSLGGCTQPNTAFPPATTTAPLQPATPEFNATTVPPLHLFVTGGAGVGKSFLIEMLRETVTRLYPDQPTEPPILLCAPTGVAAYNIGGATAHITFDIPVENSDHTGSRRVKFKQLSALKLEAARDRMKGVKYIIIDEISMVSYATLEFIHRSHPPLPTICH